MARRLEVEIVGDARSLNRSINSARSSTSGLKRSFGDLSGTVKAFAGAAVIGAAVSGIKGAITAGSNLNESTNAVRVTFGKASPKIIAFSKDAAKLGLSMNEVNELTTPLGASLINAGLSMDQAANQSIKLTKRAADMASVFNTSVPEALEAIQSGLRGEADPLERFGVNLSDAAVKAKGVEMGFKLVNGQLDAHSKAQARVALLMEQTNKVQGDFANTSDGLANTQRILRAEFENVQAELGQKLIPILQSAVAWLRDHWPEISAAVKEAWQNNVKPALQGLWELLRSIVNFVRDHWTTIGPIVKSVMGIVGGQLKIVSELLKTMAAILRGDWSDAWQHVKGVVSGVADVVRNTIRAELLLLKAELNVLKGLAGEVWSGILSGLSKIVKPFTNAAGAIQKAAAGLRGEFKTLWEVFDKLISGFRWLIDHVKAIGSFFGKIGGAVGSAAARGDATNAQLGQVRRGTPGPGAAAGAGAGKRFNVGTQLWDEIGMGQRLGLAVTSGYRPGAVTAHGTKSDHSYNPSRAVDMAGSTTAMAQMFNWLVGRKEIRQAFFDPMGSIFGGVRSSYREGGHSDHIHIAEYARGGVVPGPRGAPQLAIVHGGERVIPNGGGTIVFNFPNYVGDRRELMDTVRAEMDRHNGRNRTRF